MKEPLQGNDGQKGQQRIAASGRDRGDESFVRSIAAGCPVNRDWKPVCEYYLGYALRKRFWPGSCRDWTADGGARP